MFEKLQSIDPSLLADVVRQDQRDRKYTITDWTVGRLSDRGILHPDGLFLFSGHGSNREASTPWSIVLKLLRYPDRELDPRHLNYWKREIEAFQSGLLTRLPGLVTAPRYYGSIEFAEGVGLWMEHIVETGPSRWTPHQYAFAAQQLGRFNGAYLNETPLPDYPWLSAGLVRAWTGGLMEDLDKAWENPIVRQTFSEKIHERCRRLWVERERFYTLLDRLPQVFSHLDFQRRNLFLRKREDGQDEIVAVDWAQCGIGALGGDLSNLIGLSSLLGELDTTALPALEGLAFEAYLSGLREAGWQGNPDLVRFGYTAWVGLWVGAFAPTGTSYWTADTPWWTREEANAFALQQFGKMGQELASDWAGICEFGLDRADEARQLADRLFVEVSSESQSGKQLKKRNIYGVG